MTSLTLRALAAGLLMAAATPILAQTPPPGGMGHGGRHQAFQSMSEAGRATMMEAMRAGGDRKAEREAVKAARERMLTIIGADRLDTAALKRAMDDERNAALANRERHQAAMLAGFGKLSVADRKAFVADSRSIKSRMEQRVQDWRGRRGMRDDMPPPPPGL